MDQAKITFQELAAHVANFKPLGIMEDHLEFAAFLKEYGWQLHEYYLEVIKLQQVALQDLHQKLNALKPATVGDLNSIIEYMEKNYEKRKPDVSTPDKS